MTSSAPGRFTTWLTPWGVASLGTVIVMFLLFIPVRILAPGDHELTSCGNALAMDLDEWHGNDTEMIRYREQAFERCVDNRLDRIAQAVGATTLTLVATAFAAWVPRRVRPDSPVDDAV